MFTEMRAALGIPRSVDILDHVQSLSNIPDGPASAGHDQPVYHQANPEAIPHNEPLEAPMSSLSTPRSRAIHVIQSIERRAMTTQRPQPGLAPLMAYLTSHSIPKALCTRNFPAPVHHLLENYLPDEDFDPIITRETVGIRPKPSPDGIWKIVEHWKLAELRNRRKPGLSTSVNMPGDRSRETQNTDNKGGDMDDPLEVARDFLGGGVIMVGDSLDDMAAGYRAGAATVLLVNEHNERARDHEYTDLTIERLDDLIGILDNGFVGKDESEGGPTQPPVSS